MLWTPTPLYVGRHRAPKPARPTVTNDACLLVQQWGADCFRHLTDEVPFGPWGPGRDLDEAGELAKIDLLDRMTAIEVAAP